MGLKENLEFAQHAVNHVRTFKTKDSHLVGMRAANDNSKTPMSADELQRLEKCIGLGSYEYRKESVRNKMAFLCRNVTEEGPRLETCLQKIPDALDEMARLAQEGHCGNCQEQDAVAIKYLVGKGVKPLDFMHLHPKVDHSFIVIGRPAKVQVFRHRLVAPGQPIGPATESQSGLLPTHVNDHTTWGDDAVVCDPWDENGKVYPAVEIPDKMYRGKFKVQGKLEPGLIWRME